VPVVKTRSLVAMAALFLVSIAPGTALAEPYFAVGQGLKCSACHVNPTGGGLRNTFGSIWGQMMLPAKTLKIGSGAPLKGEFGRHFAIGTNLRADAAWLNAPGTPSVSSRDITSLRVYADLRIVPDRVSIYIDERFLPGNASNREAYVRVNAADRRFYMKAGLMYLPFGIRLQDDSAFVREQTGINFTTPDRGVEVGFDGTHWTAQVTVSNGTAGGPEIDSGKQWSLRSEYVQSRWRAGASVNINEFDAGTRRMQNVFGGLRTGRVSWLAEADYMVDGTYATARKQWGALLEADWNIRKGQNLKITAENFDPNQQASSNQQRRLSLVWEYTPIQFLQLRVGVRNYDSKTQSPLLNQQLLFLQLNAYF
jgi:hypothetical protein